MSIPLSILEVLKNSPIDIRKELSMNICVTGGCSNIPNFHEGLLNELKYHTLNTSGGRYSSLNLMDFKCIFNCALTKKQQANYGPWFGASLLALLSKTPKKPEIKFKNVISREDFNEMNGTVDWNYYMETNKIEG